MKFILTGGGDSKHFSAIDAKFISLLGDNPTLLFIPIAGDEDSYQEGLSRIQDTFSTVHFDNIEMCLDLHDLHWEYLSKFKAIYFDGGNTFQLMAHIRDTHTYELLHKFLYQGGVINGDSAGAIVLGSHLETAHFGDSGDDNNGSVISYQGLNLLGHWAIHCHYQQSEKEEIQAFVDEYGFPVVALHENSAIYIQDKNIKVIGEEKIDIYSPDSHLVSINVGDSYSLNKPLILNS